MRASRRAVKDEPKAKTVRKKRKAFRAPAKHQVTTPNEHKVTKPNAHRPGA